MEEQKALFYKIYKETIQKRFSKASHRVFRIHIFLVLRLRELFSFAKKFVLIINFFKFYTICLFL